ncbi:AraC family transcriptional regulator ligand-binding domain-containing protein [Actinoallomurus sp. NPDC050550]|uniref:AraC family transcriptional regulator n=1 Tax=Actinoallomurus sp. NPDC050550 TaxID=3154937 RepID=UPI003403526A
MTQGTVSTALARFVLNSLRGFGVDSAALSRQVGFPVWALGDDTVRVPTPQLFKVWRLGHLEFPDPHLGLRISGRWSRGRLHLHDYLFETAATLGDGFTTAIDYAHVVSDDNGADDVDVIGDDGHLTVRYQVRSPSPETSALISEFALGALLRRARDTLGAEISPVHVGFCGDPPPSHRDLVAAFGTPRVDFGQDQTTMTFAPADLEQPLPGADPVLARILRAHADAITAAPGRAPGWRDPLREAIAADLRGRTASLHAVAARLAMSPRSLQRRLEEDGTSWRQEVDAVRRDQAARLLREGASRAAMAAQLGYSDVRALRRAVRRWNLPT